jgi:hypothetical protein
LVAGATAVIKQVGRGKKPQSPWLVELLRRKPPKLVAVALANKNARVIWKLMTSGERYNAASYNPPRRMAETTTREGRSAALRRAPRRTPRSERGKLRPTAATTTHP